MLRIDATRIHKNTRLCMRTFYRTKTEAAAAETTPPAYEPTHVTTPAMLKPISPPGFRPRLVIIGAGFAGLEVARALSRAAVDIVLLDKKNHHCFQPLLYQVATAALSPADVAWPIRSIVSGQENVSV